MRTWRPGLFHRLSGLARWELALDDTRFVFRGASGCLAFDALEVTQLVADGQDRVFRILAVGTPPIELRGASHGTRRSIADAFAWSVNEARRLATLAAAADWEGRAALVWRNDVHALMERPRWADHDAVEALELRRPAVAAWVAATEDPRLGDAYRARTEESVAVEECLALDLRDWARRRNEQFLAFEEREMSAFFQCVEKSPLTAEQTRAVVCFDNRVRVIAAAGSGKTSTMVARAGYAIRRDIARPTEILALAFNKKAAGELSERMSARLGEEGSGVASSTFHAFGLRIIGEATGRKPSLAEDVLADEGHGRLRRAVDSLRDQDPSFRRDWDLFRLVFGRQLPELGVEEEAETSDRATGATGFRTLAGEVVRSQEEVMVANWLFLNGVRYEYERPYAHDVADSGHRQYQPDFYYPDIDAWHEHWALGPDGMPPASFEGYAASMAWRRATHSRFGTDLIETTSATIRDGSGFAHLEAELRRRGIELDENPYREAVGEPPITDRGMVALMRTFMTHAKGNRLAIEELRHRGGLSLRVSLFLRLYEAVAVEWERQLRGEGKIDFEDMLNLATDHVRAGRWSSPYRLVMVDEMQDMSAARADLVRVLLSAEGTYLYAVGDDWQSINRFAGSDLTVMTSFENWFGPAATVILDRTFRSPQEICDVAGAFVSKNPAQLSKHVRSTAPSPAQAVAVMSVKVREEYSPALQRYLVELNAQQEGPASVLILGRYRSAAEDITPVLQTRFPMLRLTFDSVHGSKGKEADYVVVLGVERNAFPSVIEDDPLLQFAMATSDPYPNAEERRLFYVALTRARRSVLVLTRARHESPFLLELVRDRAITIRSSTGRDITPLVCPRCKKRTMQKRKGPHGEFFGCTGYPLCTATARNR